MGKTTTIEWATATWNPWRGCTPVSSGCANCYATRYNRRWGNPRKIVRAADATFYAPLKWKEPKRIFVGHLSDFFHPDIPNDWRTKAWDIINQERRHTFLILTKRPERMPLHTIVPNNIWFGVTVENQEQADKRIPLLLQIPAAKRFVSVEPMLGPINLCNCIKCGAASLIQQCCLHGVHKLDWVICGGESGPGARPMHPDWARNLRDQCRAAEVPFFFKQWGAWASGDYQRLSVEDILVKRKPDDISGYVMFRIGKKKAGRLLDGREWSQIPK